MLQYNPYTFLKKVAFSNIYIFREESSQMKIFQIPAKRFFFSVKTYSQYSTTFLI